MRRRYGVLCNQLVPGSVWLAKYTESFRDVASSESFPSRNGIVIALPNGPSMIGGLYKFSGWPGGVPRSRAKGWGVTITFGGASRLH